jgi:nucleoside-diphosphate-sugar epimerase
MHGLIVGCGYLGRRVAQLWLDAGHKVSALTRSSETAAQFSDAGIHPILGDVTRPDTLGALPAADVLLFAVGYDRSAGPSQREVYVQGLQSTLAALHGRVGRVLYVSSTSVYGQTDGSWVDEESVTEPQTESGCICLEAERLLNNWAASTGMSRLILRLAGIYGPKRLLARIEGLRRGEPLAGRPDAWLNLIHVDDAAHVAAAYSQTSHTGVILVCDDQPVMRVEFYSHLARLLGAPAPVFKPSLAAGRTTGLNKRCRNMRLRRDLGILRCADYTEGLPDAARVDSVESHES